MGTGRGSMEHQTHTAPIQAHLLVQLVDGLHQSLGVHQLPIILNVVQHDGAMPWVPCIEPGHDTAKTEVGQAATTPPLRAAAPGQRPEAMPACNHSTHSRMLSPPTCLKSQLLTALGYRGR